MNNLTKIAGIIALGILWSCEGQKSSSGEAPIQNELDSVSYSLGVSVAKNVKSQGLNEINTDVLAQAFRDIFANKDPKINDQESQTLLNNYFQKLAAATADKNKADGEAFLETNKGNDGIITLPSGLQYQVINQGTGPMPSRGDKVSTHYHGTLIDGTVFDSSIDRGEPVTFQVNGVIAGWTEALQLMAVGSKWKLFIPSDLAYGAQSAGGVIGPNSTLIFEIELISISE